MRPRRARRAGRAEAARRGRASPGGSTRSEPAGTPPRAAGRRCPARRRGCRRWRTLAPRAPAPGKYREDRRAVWGGPCPRLPGSTLQGTPDRITRAYRRALAESKRRLGLLWTARYPARMEASLGARAEPDPADLLAGYARHRRDLPWRARPGESPDPYRVWLSEIMLQQTTVRAVGPYFARFTARWSDVRALAAAPLDDVLKLWAGLGYYARARNLHACAKAVVERHGGCLPQSQPELAALPGIGPYTAAAIAAIAFDAPAAAIDGNVERVMARLFAVEEYFPAAKPDIRRLTEGLVPAQRAGDFAQALMDLGATICTPKRPACAL